MNIPVPTGWSKNNRKPDNRKSDTLLFYAFICMFFCFPLGTFLPTVFSVIVLAIWLFSKIAFKRCSLFYEPSWIWPVLFYMALHWIGLFYTPDLGDMGISYARKTHYWLCTLAIASIPFGIFKAGRLVQAFMAGLAFNSIVSVFQVMLDMPGKTGYQGLASEYSTLAALLIIGILMASFYFRQVRERKKRFYLFVLMLLYICNLLFLNSRTGYVAFILVSPLMLRNLIDTKKIMVVLVACIMLPGLMLLSPVVRNRVNLSIDQVRYHMNANSGNAWGRTYSPQQDRFYMWHGAYVIFRNNPFIGGGTGGYKKALLRYGDPKAPSIAHPHNNFLYMAVSFGGLGILVFAWLFFGILKNSWKQRRDGTGFFVFATALVILTGGLFNTLILDAGTLFVLTAATGLQQGFPEFSGRYRPKA